MKKRISYILLFLCSIVIISCALEKEKTPYIYGVFAFTIGEVNADKVDNMPISSKPCLVVGKNHEINLLITSKGTQGEANIAQIKKSYIDPLFVTFYFDNNNGNSHVSYKLDKAAVESIPYIYYGYPSNTVSYPLVFISENQPEFQDIKKDEVREYSVTIQIDAEERSGSGEQTSTSTFSNQIGVLKIAGSEVACQNIPR